MNSAMKASGLSDASCSSWPLRRTTGGLPSDCFAPDWRFWAAQVNAAPDEQAVEQCRHAVGSRPAADRRRQRRGQPHCRPLRPVHHILRFLSALKFRSLATSEDDCLAARVQPRLAPPAATASPRGGVARPSPSHRPGAPAAGRLPARRGRRNGPRRWCGACMAHLFYQF